MHFHERILVLHVTTALGAVNTQNPLNISLFASARSSSASEVVNNTAVIIGIWTRVQRCTSVCLCVGVFRGEETRQL